MEPCVAGHELDLPAAAPVVVVGIVAVGERNSWNSANGVSRCYGERFVGWATRGDKIVRNFN